MIAGTAAGVRAVEPLSKIPQFYASNSWVVSPVKALIERGINQPGCVMANQFNNGFVVRFIGGQGQLYSMSVDFRQDVFQNSNIYDVQLRLGKGYAGQIKAQAQGSSTLVLPMQNKKAAYDALAQASLIDVGLEGSVLRFQLKDIQSSIRRMESCANPVHLSDRNANQLFPDGLLDQNNPVGYSAPVLPSEGMQVASQSASSTGMTVKGVRQKKQAQGIAYNAVPFEQPTSLEFTNPPIDPQAYVSRSDALPVIPSGAALDNAQHSEIQGVPGHGAGPSHYVPGTARYIPSGSNVGALSGNNKWESAVEARENEIGQAQQARAQEEWQELPVAATQEPLAVSDAVTASGQIENNFRQARENEQDEAFVGLRVGEVSKALPKAVPESTDEDIENREDLDKERPLHFPPVLESAQRNQEQRVAAPPISTINNADDTSFQEQAAGQPRRLDYLSSTQQGDSWSAWEEEPVLESTVNSVYSDQKRMEQVVQGSNEPVISKSVPLEPIDLGSKPTNDASNIRTWQAAAGSDARTVLESWSQEARVDLVWNANMKQAPIQKDIAVTGTFEDAVRTLLVQNSMVLGIQGELNKNDRWSPQVNSGHGSVGHSPSQASANTAIPLVWSASQGEDLKQTLDRWAQQSNVRLMWRASQNFEVKNTVNAAGTYEQALQSLLKQYDGEILRPVGNLNIDPRTNTKSLTISTISGS